MLETAKPQLLLVEDNADQAQAIAGGLRDSGYEVRVLGSGIEALERFASGLLQDDSAGRPGIVIMDIKLPYLDGLQLLEEVRRAGDQLPVIFITAAASAGARARIAAMSKAWLLEKPFGLDALQRYLDDATGIHR